MSKCSICQDMGYYYKESDRDCIEGYKLAPAYDCSCVAGIHRKIFRLENKKTAINKEISKLKKKCDTI